MANKGVSQSALMMALAAVAVPLVGTAAGVRVSTPVGEIDTRRPVLQTTDTGKVDTSPLGATIIIR